MPDLVIAGATYPSVPSIICPKDGGGSAQFYGEVKLGVIRPDAELVQTWKYDKLIHADEGVTIPAYTTTDTTLKNWEALTPTVTADLDNYNYFAQCRGLAIPIYDTTAVGAGRQEYMVNCMQQEYVNVPANSVVALADGTTKNAARQVWLARENSFNDNVYWSSGTAIALDRNACGAYISFVVDIAMGGGVITARAPLLKIRGHATYFNSTYWGHMTDIRYQYVIELYREPKGSMTLDGWNTYMLMRHAFDCAATPTHKLT